jgi:hypothetical protein
MKTVKRVAMVLLLLALVVPASHALLVILAMAFVAGGRKGLVDVAFYWAEETAEFAKDALDYIKDPK